MEIVATMDAKPSKVASAECMEFGGDAFRLGRTESASRRPRGRPADACLEFEGPLLGLGPRARKSMETMAVGMTRLTREGVSPHLGDRRPPEALTGNDHSGADLVLMPRVAMDSVHMMSTGDVLGYARNSASTPEMLTCAGPSPTTRRG